MAISLPTPALDLDFNDPIQVFHVARPDMVLNGNFLGRDNNRILINFTGTSTVGQSPATTPTNPSRTVAITLGDGVSILKLTP